MHLDGHGVHGLLELTHRSLVDREGIRQHTHLPNATATPFFHRGTASFAIVFVVAVACCGGRHLVNEFVDLGCLGTGRKMSDIFKCLTFQIVRCC